MTETPKIQNSKTNPIETKLDFLELKHMLVNTIQNYVLDTLDKQAIYEVSSNEYSIYRIIETSLSIGIDAVIRMNNTIDIRLVLLRMRALLQYLKSLCKDNDIQRYIKDIINELKAFDNEFKKIEDYP